MSVCICTLWCTYIIHIKRYTHENLLSAESMGARTSCLPTSIVQRGLPPPWEQRQVPNLDRWSVWPFCLLLEGRPIDNSQTLSLHSNLLGNRTHPSMHFWRQESYMLYVDFAWSPRSPQDVRYFHESLDKFRGVCKWDSIALRQEWKSLSSSDIDCPVCTDVKCLLSRFRLKRLRMFEVWSFKIWVYIYYRERLLYIYIKLAILTGLQYIQ